MDFYARLALIVALFSFAFILNVPMGYLRTKTRKLSLNWFLCVHATIPVIIISRLRSELDLRYIPVFILAAIVGQVFGGRIELI